MLAEVDTNALLHRIAFARPDQLNDRRILANFLVRVPGPLIRSIIRKFKGVLLVIRVKLRQNADDVVGNAILA